MPLVTHVLWGALFCLPFGFSFTALRIASLALGLLAACCIYLLLRRATASRALALGGALVLAFNPVFFALSYTFMTDVSFLAFVLIAALFFVRALQGGSDVDLALGTLCCVCAVLCRQLGLSLSIAFLPAFFVARGVSARTIPRAVLPLVLTSASLLGFESYLKASVGLPAQYGSSAAAAWSSLEHVGRLGPILEWNVVLAILYVGLFLFPFLVLLPNPFRPLRRWGNIPGLLLVAFFLAGAAHVMVAAETIMPVGGNILTAEGIGPIGLRDVYILELPHMKALPRAFWSIVTGISLIGGVLAIGWTYRSIAALSSGKGSGNSGDPASRRSVGVLAAAGIACYSAPVLLLDPFDRYLLPLVPCFMLLWIAGGAAAQGTRSRDASESRPTVNERIPRLGPSAVLPALAFAAVAAFAVAGTRDYLALNRTRWAELNTLTTEESVPPQRIDGGFEFNGWYLYEPLYAPIPDKSWWWVQDDEYVVAMGPLEGYEVLRRHSFTRWLIAGRDEIFVLRRREASSPSPGRPRL